MKESTGADYKGLIDTWETNGKAYFEELKQMRDTAKASEDYHTYNVLDWAIHELSANCKYLKDTKEGK